MATTDPATPNGHKPNPPDLKWTPDDTVVLCFAIFGFGGGIMGYVLHWSSVVPSLLFGVGVAALVYRFLGGISGTSFGVGALKLTGTLAAVIGITYFLDGQLQQERIQPSLKSEDFKGTTWRWVYGKGGLDGFLRFDVDEKGQITFEGDEQKCTAENDCKPIYRLSQGHAQLINGDSLTMKSKVHDFLYNRDFEWEGTAPFHSTLAFRGDLQPLTSYHIPNTWGMMIYKVK